MTATATNIGLDGVIAAETKLSAIDGEQGQLIIGGYSLEQVATQLQFEELVYLLWYGTLPTVPQLKAFDIMLKRFRQLPDNVLDVLRVAARQQKQPMDALRIGLSVADLDQQELDSNALSCLILSRSASIVATYQRLLSGDPPVAPDDSLSHAANYLYMGSGVRPTQTTAKGMETYLNTVIEHGLNASTFAARVIIATQSDLLSAVVGAVGALKGPLHGGAPGPALEMVFEIGSAENAEPAIRAKLNAGERLMGFGHRVYKVRDPRADVLAAAAEALYVNGQQRAFYELAKTVETVAIDLLAEYKPGRRLQTNVEFYTALLLHGLQLDPTFFAPTFAIARVAGWIAHCYEQSKTGRLIRPKSRYVGERNTSIAPIALRSHLNLLSAERN